MIIRKMLEYETIDVEHVDGPPQRSAVCPVCGERVTYREWADDDEIIAGGCEHTVSKNK